jgi:hypothetical protein
MAGECSESLVKPAVISSISARIREAMEGISADAVI